MPAFFCKKSAFFNQNSTFTQRKSERVCVRDFLVLFSVFVLCVRYPDSGLLQIDPKFEKSQWRHNFWTWRHCQVFLDIFLFFLSNLVTGPSFMSMSSLVLDLWQFLLKGIDQKSRNLKYPRLNFDQYLEITASYEYQVWHKCFS